MLPCFSSKNYLDLEIGKGDVASILYFKTHYGTDGVEKEKVRENLLIYCKQDTEAMMEIVEGLKGIK